MFDWTAFFTLLLFLVAMLQLMKSNDTSSAEFLHKLKVDLMNEKSSLLISLLDNKCLKLIYTENNDEKPYFQINFVSIKNQEIIDELKRKINKIRDGSYVVESFEIDEYLLGHFEDLGILEEKGILDKEMIYEEFSWLIEICLENEDIKKYVEKQRKKYWDLYDKAESLASKCKKFGEEKANKIKKANILNPEPKT